MALTKYLSRYTEVPRKCDEVQGAPALAVVLPSLSKAMSRREWIQVPCTVRIPSEANACGRRECWSAYQRLLWSVPVGVCHSLVAEVSTWSKHPQTGKLTKCMFCRFGTKRVHANRVYQEFIQDKHHLHMNATRWVTLSEFVKHLGRSGIARVDETEKGWFLAWIDNSPKALAKAVCRILDVHLHLS